LRLRDTQGVTAEHVYFTGTGTAYDPETGEALVYGPASTHKVVSIKRSEAFKDRGEFKGRQRDFTFSVMDVLHEVTNALTTAQCGYLLLLQCYVNYGDGRLLNADKTVMSTSDMRNILNVSRSTFHDFLTRATEHNFILAHGDGSYSINERYHFRGSAPAGESIVKSYTAKVRRIYGRVKPADLGLIYRMLPLVHYATNTLCSNPNESVPEMVHALNRKELAELIGVSVGEISRRLPKLTVDGEYVIAKVTVGGVESYMFNPWVFYRKTTQPDDTLRRLFSVKAVI